jgi:hypothetical protein
MENKTIFKDLSVKELIITNGGWNVVEYMAMGVGYVHYHLAHMRPISPAHGGNATWADK